MSRHRMRARREYCEDIRFAKSVVAEMKDMAAAAEKAAEEMSKVGPAITVVSDSVAKLRDEFRKGRVEMVTLDSLGLLNKEE